MTYETHELEQGSAAWFAHRDTCYNASELAAAMGSSRYKTRSALIAEIATGAKPEIDARTQKRFDDGHRFEALARPLAEEIVGEDLFPASVSLAVAGLNRRLGASYDGKTMADTANWEHKTLNDALAASLDMGIIPDEYHAQMEQGMLINGAERCLFSASKWDDADELVDIKHTWYESNPVLRASIIPTWKQIEHDATNYQPDEVIPAAVASPTLDLPVVSIQTSGSIVIRSNLRAFGEALNSFIERLPSKPSTDQEFADCKAALSKLKTAEETLESEEARALSQMTEIDEMRREKKLYQDLARTTRLAIEKLVTARESAIKLEIMQEGKDKLAAHIAGLDKRLARVHMPVVVADFASAIKGKRTVESLRNAVDTLLAAKKIEANEIADKIQINLATLDEHKGHAFLFSDVARLVMKDPDDLQAVITNRIATHKAEQEAKLEAERARIRAEEQAKAQREADAKVAAERAEQAKEAARIAAEAAAAQKAIDDAAAEAQREADASASKQLHDIALAQASERQARQDSAPATSNVASIEQPQPTTWLAELKELTEQMTDNEGALLVHYGHRLISERQAAA